MAPRTRTRRRQSAISTKPQSSPAPISPALFGPLFYDSNDDHSIPRNAEHDVNEAGNTQNTRPWTPEPEPYDPEKYQAWGRKHYGEDWYQQRETMLRERNFYRCSVKEDDYVYMDRQKALRKLEREREEGKLPMKKGKTWEELYAWARMHYGETWWAHREALDRDRQEEREALDPRERKKKSSKAAKRTQLLTQLRIQRDEGMLAEGKTWDEIMAWPAEPSNTTSSGETGIDAIPSPSGSSEHSDHSGYSTYPPTPTDARRQAMSGPQGLHYQREGNWHWLEWSTIGWRLSKRQYEESKLDMRASLRSRYEDEGCDRRNREEWDAIHALKWTDQDEYYRQKKQRELRMRDLDFRLKGWTQEQIDAVHREEAAEEERVLKRWQSILQRAAEPIIAEGQSASGVEPQLLASSPRQTEDVSRKTRKGKGSRPLSGESSRKTSGGRITKAKAQTQTAPRRSPRSRQPAAIPSETPTRGRGSRRSKLAPGLDEPGTPRRSRRLAKQLPEFGMLLGRNGKALYKSLVQPSSTRKTRASGNSGSTPSKPAVSNAAKPQGVSKSRQTRASKNKRAIKGSDTMTQKSQRVLRNGPRRRSLPETD